MAEDKSAVAAWLDLPSTKQEMTAARKRLALLGTDPGLAPFFVLGIEILAALEVYEITTLDSVTELPPEDPKEPWQG